MYIRYKYIIFFSILISIWIFHSCINSDPLLLQSPDGNLTTVIELKREKSSYTLIFHKDTLLKESQLGVIFNNDTIQKNLKITGIDRLAFDESWQSIAGKNKRIRNQYNQLIISCQTREKRKLHMDIEFRCFNDGLAFRYHFPEKESPEDFELDEDLTSFDFPHDFKCWSANGANHNPGPLTVPEFNKLGKQLIQTPLVAETPAGSWLAIHEAGIFDFSNFLLIPNPEKSTLHCKMFVSRGTTPAKTSWRTIITGGNAGDLVESNLLANLNPPCSNKDFSWVKPGKALWTWRIMGYKCPDGFVYDMDTESVKRLIDFAGENNIQYILIDAQWYGPEFEKSSDPRSSISKFNISDVITYANRKNVEIILYLNDIGAIEYGLENILSQFYKWGVAGVKYGFMKGNGQEKVLHTRNIVELCAKFKLLIDFHDNPVPPSGDLRTWPNLITREYGHAQADAKRSYWPETAVTAPFVNMIAGPLDLTNGWFGLNKAHEREKVFEEIPGTVVAEVAKIAVIYSGLVVLPDAPEEYSKKADLFAFIREFPSDFDEFKVLDGRVGEFITVARRSGDQWFIGSLTNREGRSLDLTLNFLEPDKKYVATLYEDAIDSDYLKNKESYTIKHIAVQSGSKITARLAPGGGHAVWIKPAE